MDNLTIEKNYNNKYFMLIILLIALLSRFINIGTQGIQIDETWVVPTTNFHFESDDIYPKIFENQQYLSLPLDLQKIIRKVYDFHPLVQVTAIRAASDVHPPLYFFFNYYWSKWFGYDVGTIRTPAAIYFIITLFLVWKILRKQKFGDGIIIAVISLLTISPIYLFLSNYARPYTLLLLLCLLSSFLASVVVSERFKRKIVIFYVASAVSCMYTHYYGILVVASQSIYIILESYLNKDFKNNFIKIVLIQLAIGLIFLPWALVIMLQMKLRFGRLAENGALVHFDLNALRDLILFFGAAYSRSTVFSPINILVSSLQLFLFFLGVRSQWGRKDDPVCRFWLFFFFVPFLFIIIANTINPVFTVRNCTIILIPYLAIIGFGFSSIKRSFLKIVFGLIIGLVGIYSILYGLSYGDAKGSGAVEDWKEVANVLKTIQRKNIYVYHSSYRDALYYYIPNENIIRALDDNLTLSGPEDKEFMLIVVNHGAVDIDDKIQKELKFINNNDIKYALFSKIKQIYIYSVFRQ